MPVFSPAPQTPRARATSPVPQASSAAQAPSRSYGGLAGQVLRFLCSGGAATLLHWATMAGLIAWGLSPIWATTTGAIAGSMLNYLLQSRWTFNANPAHKKVICAYVATVALGWGVNAAVLQLLIWAVNPGYVLAQLCATGSVALLNFVLYKRYVFNERAN